MEYRVLNLGDRAITFEFGSVISRRVSHHVLGVHAQLKESIAQGLITGIIETVPTFRSLTVHYDPLELLADEVEALVAPYIKAGGSVNCDSTHWSFPVCYEGDYAPDIADVAEKTGLTIKEVVDIHQREVFDVFMLGFLPGFAFLGLLDERLQLPRRSEPRTAVPRGSVAIADQLTAIYPTVSPGGWNLIGSTPIELFDIRQKDAALLKAGDRVGFHAVSEAEYKKIEAAVAAGGYSYRAECQIKEVA
ncbi:5-oxoprolinase subunit PxpB [Terasakiella sp. A23]|uniref:5-oxoprolinase subunit PxpB n=1 Tax=Terasakiella sp. FCG-A23 TaxID=3080561 RepID=UPI0029555845|nr:5-oxoprolinase subunit PxpB [Terasakiella sp. A23]MDV7339170.1 5-oxoprolinase subunit PxpB [Terasakiella sp. A23]